MRNRNILKMILLTIVTFGIYYLYWLVSTAREMRQLGAEIPNAILIIIPIINIWWMWEYSKGVEHVTNNKLSAVLAFILMYVVGFIGIYIVQDSFNGVSAQGGASVNPMPSATTADSASASPAESEPAPEPAESQPDQDNAANAEGDKPSDDESIAASPDDKDSTQPGPSL